MRVDGIWHVGCKLSNADGGNEIAADRMDGSLTLSTLLELKYQKKTYERSLEEYHIRGECLKRV